MSLSYYNEAHINSRPKLWLCRPDRTPIHKLKDIYNAKLSEKLGSTNELTFEISALVERNHQLVSNPMIEQFMGEYLIKSVWEDKIEYFVNTKDNKVYSNNGESIQYTFYSIGHQLNNYIVRRYNEDEVPFTLRNHLMEILKETNWTIDIIDTKFEVNPTGKPVERMYSVSEATVFQCVVELAEKFGALIQWDTLNEKISLRDPKSIGLNRGMKFKEGRYLESFNVELNYNEIVTRLNVYGEDGLEFRRLSPTGSNYIESFDWYIYPFECDSNYNVLKSSKYMSDNLCIAIKKYEDKIKNAEGQFESLTTQATDKEDERKQLNQELSVLVAEMNVIENELWVINKTLNDMISENNINSIPNGTVTHPQSSINSYEQNRMNIISRKNTKQSQIDSKKSQITSIENQQQSLQDQLDSLRTSLSVDTNFTRAQIKERNRFIKMKSHTNDSISDEEDLLEEGLRVFKLMSVPPITVQISIHNFLNDIEHKSIRDKLTLGDTVIVQSKNLNVKVSLKLLERTFDFESENITLTISNEQDLRDDWKKFLEKVYTASNTSTTVNMDKYRWDVAEEAMDGVSQILNNEWDATRQALFGGYAGLTKLDDFGLRSYEHNNSDTFLFINNGLLGITSDNGNSFQVSISKRGVHSERLVGRLILSNKLMVEDEKGIIEMKSGNISIFNPSGKKLVEMGNYKNPYTNADTHGLNIIDGSFHIRTSSTSLRGLEMDVNGIRAYNNNGVRTFDVNATTGQVSIIGSMNIKSSSDSYRGVEIDGNGLRIYNNTGLVMFSADHYGNLFYRGELRNAYGTVTNLTGSINNMDGTFVGTLQGVDGTFSGTLTSATLDTGTLNAISIRADQITSGKISSSLIDTTSLTAATIEVDQLRAQGIQVTNLSSISSDLGNITGGRIDIDTDMSIGNNLYIGSSFQNQNKSIVFGGGFGGARINYNNDTISISAINGVTFDGGSTRFNGTVDFSQANVIGL